jgi:hypothetical protein
VLLELLVLDDMSGCCGCCCCLAIAANDDDANEDDGTETDSDAAAADGGDGGKCSGGAEANFVFGQDERHTAYRNNISRPGNGHSDANDGVCDDDNVCDEDGDTDSSEVFTVFKKLADILPTRVA